MDRDYWRSESDVRLIDEARSSGHELCIALGERLEENAAETDKYTDQLYWLRVEIAKLTNTIEQLKRKK